MNHLHARLLIAIPLIILGLLLTQYRNDRKFIDLSPTAGITNSLPLTVESELVQSFTIHHDTITRLGFYLHPAARNIPTGNIRIDVSQGGNHLGTATVSSVFLDSEGATQFRFNPPLRVDLEQLVDARITIADNLNGAVRLQLRQPDDSVDPATVSLYLNGEKQSAPAAYLAASVIRPPLAIQLGGLMILSGFLILYFSLVFYILAAPLIYLLPFTNSLNILPLYFYSAIALTGFIILARMLNLPLTAAIFGANIFAFTTWYPLHFSDDRSAYLFFSLIPFLAIFFVLPPETNLRKKFAFSLFLIVASSLLVINYSFNAPSPLSAPNIKDVFLDPQQSPLAVKTDSPWSNYGAYLGVIPACLALLGLISGALKNFRLEYHHQHQSKKYYNPYIFYAFAISFALVFVPDIASFASRLGIPAPHLIILAVFFIALFAADGLHSLFRFIFPKNIPHFWLPLVLAISLIILSLLDLWHVSATVLEHL